jgi:hypothetical protein
MIFGSIPGIQAWVALLAFRNFGSICAALTAKERQSKSAFSRAKGPVQASLGRSPR